MTSEWSTPLLKQNELFGQKDTYFIRCRAEALHSGLFLHFFKTQVSPSFFLRLAPFLASSLLPAQEDVVFLPDTNQKRSAKGQTAKQ